MVSLEEQEKRILKEIESVENESKYVHLTGASDVYTKLSALKIDLLRLSALRNEKSSKRFAYYSLAIGVVAIVVAATLSLVQTIVSLKIDRCIENGSGYTKCISYIDAGIFGNYAKEEYETSKI